MPKKKKTPAEVWEETGAKLRRGQSPKINQEIESQKNMSESKDIAVKKDQLISSFTVPADIAELYKQGVETEAEGVTGLPATPILTLVHYQARIKTSDGRDVPAASFYSQWDEGIHSSYPLRIITAFQAYLPIKEQDGDQYVEKWHNLLGCTDRDLTMFFIVKIKGMSAARWINEEQKKLFGLKKQVGCPLGALNLTAVPSIDADGNGRQHPTWSFEIDQENPILLDVHLIKKLEEMKVKGLDSLKNYADAIIKRNNQPMDIPMDMPADSYVNDVAESLGGESIDPDDIPF